MKSIDKIKDFAAPDSYALHDFNRLLEKVNEVIDRVNRISRTIQESEVEECDN